MRFLVLFSLLGACATAYTPAVDGGQLAGDSAPAVDAGDCEFRGAVAARSATLHCSPAFRCPCASRPVPDACYDRVAAAAWDCAGLDRELARCGALEDGTEVCQ